MCLSIQQVCKWSRRFQNAVSSVKDCTLTGQVDRTVTPESNAEVERLVQINRRLTVTDVAAHCNINQFSHTQHTASSDM